MKRNEELDSKKEEIISLYESGMTQSDIAKHFGISQTAISTRLRKWEVSNPDGNRFKRTAILKEDLYDMYWNKEMHPSAIAEKYGCTKMVIHNRMKKFGIPTRTKSESRIGKLNPIYGVGHTEEAKRKMSEAFLKGREVGFNNRWGTPTECVTPNQGFLMMRSGWEAKTAEYLTNEGIDWYYEYTVLELGNGMTYTPDFYLPDYNTFLEVKGRMKDIDIIKIGKARKLGYKIDIWTGIELLKRGIIDNCGDAALNRKYRKRSK